MWVADPNLWAPFADGTSFAQWNDDARTQANLERLGVSDADIKGYWAYEEIFDEMRKRLRTGARDSWIGASPSRAELEEMLGGDQTMIDILFDASIADVLESYVSDPRLVRTRSTAKASSGPTPARATGAPRSVKLMHYQGDLQGQGPVWGYVEGGMGRISFAIAEAARDLGAVLAAGAAGGRDRSGRGGAPRGRRPDPRHDGARATPTRSGRWHAREQRRRARRRSGSGSTAWQIRVAGREVQRRARPAAHVHRRGRGAPWPYQLDDLGHPRLDAAQAAFEACEAGEPAVGFGEVYFQTGFDPSPAPEGKHLMSVFGQYAPYEFADGTLGPRIAPRSSGSSSTSSRPSRPTSPTASRTARCSDRPTSRSASGSPAATSSRARRCPTRCGSTASRPARPIDGFYFCGASTHPAGTVIGLNGRNAAMAVLEDQAATA